MEQQYLVSVIIPVYNVEKYLKRCVESVLRQTYRNLEIWLVDDGATDCSGMMCDEFAQKDTRIRVIHKENGGLSDARNVAIDKMTGQYVTFIDSDDYVSENFIERLYMNIRKYAAEIAICRHISTKKSDEQCILGNCIEIFTKEEALEELLYQKKFNTSAWAKLYKSSLFENVRYPKGKLFEDICTTDLLINRAQQIVFDSSILYFYYQGEVSIVRSSFNLRKLDYVENAKVMQQFIYNNYPFLKQAADFRFLWANLHVWVNIPDKKKYKDICAKLEKNIKKYRNSALKNKHVSLKNKMPIMLSVFGWKLTRLFYLLSKK